MKAIALGTTTHKGGSLNVDLTYRETDLVFL